jgi:hypothetical protein
MYKVDYDLDIDTLSPEDFDYFCTCVEEAAYEDGCTKAEVLNNMDTHISWYFDKACEKFHFHNRKLGKVLRSLQNIDVYEVTKEGQCNYYKTYDSRFHMSMEINKIYNLQSAFAFCPEKGIGYVIHGNISECKDYLSTMIFLYKEREAQKV